MQESSSIFAEKESNVRSYCRSFPTTFTKAKGSLMYDSAGKKYIDFFAGAGALNYGHNNQLCKDAILDYINNDGITHSLDMFTEAKQQFLEKFDQIILKPRGYRYKIQFTGPTGTNAIEAALKIARKVKKRPGIITFTNGYHGLTGSALAVTGNQHYHNPLFSNRLNSTFFPFDGYFGPNVDTVAYLRAFLTNSGSGVDLPAAIIIETIQAEGGINVAQKTWLQSLSQLCQEFDILLIIDDIQVGCGRTGSFFSFETAGIEPDIVVLSKSISGIGQPMAIVLLQPELDQWEPGEHTGTFRGNNWAFIGATAALSYWETTEFSQEIKEKEQIIQTYLKEWTEKHPKWALKNRGRGLIYGIELPTESLTKQVSSTAFEHGLIIERCGPNGNVLKMIPPLIIELDLLHEGMNILYQSLGAAYA